MERERITEDLQHADWYLRLKSFVDEKIMPASKEEETTKLKNDFYETVEEMLVAGKIPLAKDGPDYDQERKPIDTIIVHHTAEEPDIRLSKLSAIGLIRQYGKDYSEGDVLGYDVKGKPIWSNHFKDGKMVFYAYHWLIRPNGEAKRLLEDENIGWQAGNWDINTRSVGIAISGDYLSSRASNEQINSIKEIINSNYSQIKNSRIFGHREVNPKTACPGNLFLGKNGWKNDI